MVILFKKLDKDSFSLRLLCIVLQFPLTFSLLLASFTESASMAIALVPSRQKVEINCYANLQASTTNQYHISTKQVYLNSVFIRDPT